MTASDFGHPLVAAEVRAIIGRLIEERNELARADDPAAAEAVGDAIEYWETVLTQADSRAEARGRESRRQAATHAFRCVACGLVTHRRAAPESCPRCRGSVWEFVDEALPTPAGTRPDTSTI